MNMAVHTQQSDEQALEARLKHSTAPRLTPADIDRVIVKADYHVFPGNRMTVCCITLRNGFLVIGESSCVHAENFNEQIGRDIAFKNAREKIWALEGYLLREKLQPRSV